MGVVRPPQSAAPRLLEERECLDGVNAVPGASAGLPSSPLCTRSMNVSTSDRFSQAARRLVAQLRESVLGVSEARYGRAVVTAS